MLIPSLNSLKLGEKSSINPKTMIFFCQFQNKLNRCEIYCKNLLNIKNLLHDFIIILIVNEVDPSIRCYLGRVIYSSSSSSAPPPLPWPFFMFLRLTRPGRPCPNGDFVEKSMCFCESNRTTNDGMFTTCLRTLHEQK